MHRLGAVQAQDHGPAKWSVGERVNGVGGDGVGGDRVGGDGSILRTHLPRPTWHFVVPADIRWLLALTAPRVHALNAYSYRQLELDDAVRGRSEELPASALVGHDAVGVRPGWREHIRARRLRRRPL